MCAPMLAPLAAGLAGAGGTMAAVGTVAGLASGVMGAVSANRAAQANARLMRQRGEAESQIATMQDQRERRILMRQARQQAAELVGRGVQLDSPTALMLGQEAGQELSFRSQAIRSGAQAQRTETDWSARMAEAQGRQALLTGTLSAAGRFLTAAPDVWPSLLSGGEA